MKKISYAILFIGIILSYMFCRSTGLYEDSRTIQALMILAVLGIVIYAGYRYKTGKWKEDDFEKFLCLAGIVMRVGYMLYTPCYVRSHDIWDFSVNERGHSGYLLTLMQSKQLPQTNELQFYQQPLYYLLGAVVSKIVNILLQCDVSYLLVDAAKLVSVIASCLMLLMMRPLCSLIGLEKRGRCVAICVAAFLPANYLSGGRVGPDALTAFFMMLALVYTLRWWKDISWKHTVILAVVYGCGMMTKISCGLMAIFTAVCFLVRLIQSVKLKDTKPLLVKYMVFAVISLPLGLWYSIRNYILFGQPLTYVLNQGEASELYIGDIPIASRLFFVNWKNLLATPYAAVYEDYNAPVYYIKTALFGEFSYVAPEWIPRCLLMFSVLLSLFVVLACVWQIVQNRKDRMGMMIVSLFVMIYVSALMFAASYPHGCSMDYRYYLIMTVPAAALLGKYYEKTKKGWKQGLILTSLTGYALFSILMYVAI